LTRISADRNIDHGDNSRNATDVDFSGLLLSGEDALSSGATGAGEFGAACGGAAAGCEAAGGCRGAAPCCADDGAASASREIAKIAA
jgi:hypothetical protein